MNVLCIIPARGGSKGIPRKNLQCLAGKPLIAWSIEAARESDSVTRVTVSTDDREIASVAQAWGAETIDRPSDLAGDTAPSESSLLHALEYLEGTERYKADLVVFLQATSPYRLPTDIDGAVNMLLTGKYDSVFSAYAEHFIGRWHVGGNGKAQPLNFNPSNRPRRQDRDIEYLENGSIYVFKPDILQAHGVRMGGRIGIYPMPTERSWQIDTTEDLSFLGKLMSPASPEGSERKKALIKIPPPETLRRVQLLALDFDGVLTDNRVWVNDQGQETICCSRADSWGLHLLQKIGIKTAVISTERNPVVQARCNKLDIPCISNTKDKAAALSQLAASMNIDRAAVAFIGNDTNDREALCWAGIAILVSDADPTLVPIADWILAAPGGQGAVRECCDAILCSHEVPQDSVINQTFVGNPVR